MNILPMKGSRISGVDTKKQTNDWRCLYGKC